MIENARLAVASVVVTLTLAMAVGSASANRLSLSNQNITAAWAELEFTSNTGRIARCGVTLEGSLHTATIVKSRGALIGYITRATAANCSSPTTLYFALEATVPWHITYQSFSGALPNLRSVRLGISRPGFLVTWEGTNRCLYEEERWLVDLNRVAGTTIESIQPVSTSSLALRINLSGVCPTEGTFSRTGQFYTGSRVALRLTLI